MTRLLVITLVPFFMSCENVAEKKQIFLPTAYSNTVQVKLIDSLGIINLSVPLRYDTNYSWVHYSDCGKPCDEQKYRFQSKELRLIKESTWMWTEPSDSIDRFTISHILEYPFHDGDTMKNLIRHDHLKKQLTFNNRSLPIIFDTIQKFNDRFFSIIVMEKTDTIQRKKVLAVTTIKNNQIKFEYELLTKQNDSISKNFINNSISFIKTIRISKGP